jgi:uncharacterized membrane protein YphA (DoxX/SURF4 family)
VAERARRTCAAFRQLAFVSPPEAHLTLVDTAKDSRRRGSSGRAEGVWPVRDRAMLTVRQRVGLNLPPLFLRLVLGAIFLWAGLGKVADRVTVEGSDRLALTNMGVLAAPAAATKESSAKDAAAKPAAEISGPAEVLRVYRLALRLHVAANPGADEQGKPRMVLWPETLGRGAWPVRLAWMVALAELFGGVCVLLGLLTRVWAVVLAGVMIGAIWLTEIGPAVQAGGAALGFLPRYSAFDYDPWRPLMLQCCLLAMACSLAALGSGRLGLDHAVMKTQGGDVDDDD